VRHDSIPTLSCAHCNRYHQSVFVTDRLRSISLTTSETSQVLAQHIQAETLEAVVHETYEQHQTSRGGQYSSSMSMEGSLRDTPTGLGLDYDMERGEGGGT
jgi:hypothetical protein